MSARKATLVSKPVLALICLGLTAAVTVVPAVPPDGEAAPVKVTEPGPVLILPYYAFDPEDPAITTFMAVRNGTGASLNLRFEYFPADGDVATVEEMVELGSRSVRVVDLRSIGGLEPRGWATVTVISEDGIPLFDVAGISGDFFRLDRTNNFASGAELLSQDPLDLRAARPVPIPLPKVVNGLPSADVPAAAAVLANSNNVINAAKCSGVLIGCRTLLTTAGCLDSERPASAVFVPSAGIFEIEAAIPHPAADPGAGVNDVGLVRLAAPVNGVSPLPINASGRPPVGTTATLVGFGSTVGDGVDAGIKRRGAVVTGSCAGAAPVNENLCWDFDAPIGAPGSESNACLGDAGAPLLADLGDGEVVVGVAAGGLQASCQADDRAWASDIFVHRDWIVENGGADLFNTTCGGLPQTGTDEVTVAFELAEIDAGLSERFSVEVPPGVSRLRVALSASGPATGDSSVDTDLFVRFGAPPDTISFDCAGEESGAFEFCEIFSPEPGTWNVLADQGSASPATTVQVITTLFEQPRAAMPGLCRRWDARFFNGGGFSGGTNFTFFVPGNPQNGAPVVMGTVYNQQGERVKAISLRNNDLAFEVNSLDLNLEANFGVIEWSFAGGLEGHVTSTFDASGQFSVGVPAICVDGLDR